LIGGFDFHSVWHCNWLTVLAQGNAVSDRVRVGDQCHLQPELNQVIIEQLSGSLFILPLS
jgi:hypothetical protein